jgi:hypothetical protein
LDDVIRYWEHGDPEKGLMVPLSKWRDLYEPSQYSSEAQKLSVLRSIYLEFTVNCAGDWSTFEAAFPGLRYQYTKLIAAVRKARIQRGDARARKRR